MSQRKTGRITISLLCVLCMLAVASVFSLEPAFAVSKSAFKKARVSGVKVSSRDYQTLRVSWSPMNGATGYVVYSSESHYGKYRKAVTVKKGTVKFADVKKCSTGKTYYFKVQAYMSGAKSQFSYVKTGKAVPAKPKVKLSAVEALAPRTHIDADYEKVAGASGYEIWRSGSKSGKYTKLDTVSAKTLKYTDTTAKENTTYFYRVRAYRKVSGKKVYGPYSSVKSITYVRLAGNEAQYNAANVAKAGPDLSGKSFFFLGSSVTRGRGGEGQSFADQLAVRNGLTAVKEAVDGTTLVTTYANSYIERMKNLPKAAPDALVCQLSSNDSRIKVIPIGGEPIPGKYSQQDFDQETVTGAIEYVIAYARDTWGCPVVFYTLPKFSSDVFDDQKYGKMVTQLNQVQAKWKDEWPVYVLDLWNDAQVNAKLASNPELYMSDAIHPTKAGYLDLYTPGMADLLDSLGQVQSQMETGTFAEEYKGAGVLSRPDTTPIVLGEDGLPADDTLRP